MTGLEIGIATAVAAVTLVGMYGIWNSPWNEETDKVWYVISHIFFIGFALDLLVGVIIIGEGLCHLPSWIQDQIHKGKSDIPKKEMETVIQNLTALGVQQSNEYGITFNQGVDLNIERQQIEFRKTNKIYKISTQQMNQILNLVKEDKTLSLLKDLGSALEEAKREADKRNQEQERHPSL